jgi:hypothetical protein
VACLHQDARNLFPSQLIGQIDVLLPTRRPTSNQTEGLHLAREVESGLLDKSWLFRGQVYAQSGCAVYECSSFLLPQDFDFRLNEDFVLLQAK